MIQRTEHPAPLSWPAKLSLAAKDIKLAHSIFALPFALLGGCLATGLGGDWLMLFPVSADRLASTQPPRLTPFERDLAGMFALIIVCMVIARTFAMLTNRFLDRHLDAENPRTAQRAFAANRLGQRDAIIMLTACLSLFALATAAFGVFFGNWLPVLAGPLVLAWLAFYSYTKRFTALCHLVLGVALALSPIAAAGAIGGIDAVAFWPNAITSPDGGTSSIGWFDNNADIYLLAAFVACWVAGFDVIYAMQDEAFDRGKGLHSIPARLGTRGAAWVARGLHAAAIAALIGVGIESDQLGLLFTSATALTVVLLAAEHAILSARGHGAIPLVFFTLNGVVAIVLGVAGTVDILL